MNIMQCCSSKFPLDGCMLLEIHGILGKNLLWCCNLYLECLNFWDECLLFLYSVLKTINSPAQNKKVIRNATMFCGESFSLKIIWTHVEQEWSWKEVAVGCFIDFFAQLHVDADKLRYGNLSVKFWLYDGNVFLLMVVKLSW